MLVGHQRTRGAVSIMVPIWYGQRLHATPSPCTPRSMVAWMATLLEELQLAYRAPTSGIMISGLHLLALGFCTSSGGLDDGPHLHVPSHLRKHHAAGGTRGTPSSGSSRAAPRPACEDASRRLTPVSLRHLLAAPATLSFCGRNSCSGGSSRRMVTGKPVHRLGRCRRSRCLLERLHLGQRASCGPPRWSARIISRTAAMRSSLRRTCARCGTGRCPSAPNSAGLQRCRPGVSALVRIFSVLVACRPSVIRVAKSPVMVGLDGLHACRPSRPRWCR